MGHGDPQAFFETAATLIPLLLLGGVVVDRLHAPRKGEWKRWHWVPLIYIPYLGMLVVVAEVVALEAIITGSTDTPHAIVVLAAVTLGMLSVIFAVTVPWIVSYRRNHGDSIPWWLSLGMVVLFVGISGYAWGPTIDTIRAVSNDQILALRQTADEEFVLRQFSADRQFTLSKYRISKLETAVEQAASGRARHRAERQLKLERRFLRESVDRVRTLAAKYERGEFPGSP